MAFMPEPGRTITSEELARLVTILVRQLGGSVVIDSSEWIRTRENRKTVQILTQQDPWAMILKEVDAE